MWRDRGGGEPTAKVYEHLPGGGRGGWGGWGAGGESTRFSKAAYGPCHCSLTKRCVSGRVKVQSALVLPPRPLPAQHSLTRLGEGRTLDEGGQER